VRTRVLQNGVKCYLAKMFNEEDFVGWQPRWLLTPTSGPSLAD